MGAKNNIDFATLTASSTLAVGLDSASPALSAGATVHEAFFTFEGAQARWRADGTAPTTSEGHLMFIGDDLDFTDGNWRSVLGKIKFIAVSGTAKIKISYLD